MVIEKPKRTYRNAGIQNQQGMREANRLYHKAQDSDLFTVKCISLVLGIRLQMVKQLPVERIMIDKRGYYRKGDIRAWLEVDMSKPDSLIKKLRDEHAKSVARMRKQPSRFYTSEGGLTKDEAKQAREKTKTNRLQDADPYEAWRYPWVVGHIERLKDKKKS